MCDLQGIMSLKIKIRSTKLEHFVYKMDVLHTSEIIQTYTVPLETDTVTFCFLYKDHVAFKGEWDYLHIDPTRDCIGGPEYYSMLDTPFYDTFEAVCDVNDLNYEDFFFYYRNGNFV